ncbi:MAG: hypothetical protein ACJ79I_02970 [Gemmatimonadaceae bacterium]
MPASFTLRAIVKVVSLLAGVATSEERPFGGRLFADQPTLIHIRVIDDVSRRPLANADVIDLATGRHQLTGEEGNATLVLPTARELRLRVRQLGYQPTDTTITQENQRLGRSTVFALRKIAYVMSSVRLSGRCTTAEDSGAAALSASVLGQLRQAAEKAEEFRRSYPFDATVERRTVSVGPSGKVLRAVTAKEKFRSESWEARYRPGDIVEHAYDGSFKVPLLFLTTVADSNFWNHHCFGVRGMEGAPGNRAIRLEFSPNSETRGPDWAGSALLDSATSSLLRVEFRVVGLRNSDPQRIEGYTTFTSPSPFVVLPDSTVAAWWIADLERTPGVAMPSYVQGLKVVALKYRKAKPPAIR